MSIMSAHLIKKWWIRRGPLRLIDGEYTTYINAAKSSRGFRQYSSRSNGSSDDSEPSSLRNESNTSKESGETADSPSPSDKDHIDDTPSKPANAEAVESFKDPQHLGSSSKLNLAFKPAKPTDRIPPVEINLEGLLAGHRPLFIGNLSRRLLPDEYSSTVAFENVYYPGPPSIFDPEPEESENSTRGRRSPGAQFIDDIIRLDAEAQTKQLQHGFRSNTPQLKTATVYSRDEISKVLYKPWQAFLDKKIERTASIERGTNKSKSENTRDTTVKPHKATETLKSDTEPQLRVQVKGSEGYIPGSLWPVLWLDVFTTTPKGESISFMTVGELLKVLWRLYLTEHSNLSQQKSQQPQSLETLANQLVDLDQELTEKEKANKPADIADAMKLGSILQSVRTQLLKDATESGKNSARHSVTIHSVAAREMADVKHLSGTIPLSAFRFSSNFNHSRRAAGQNSKVNDVMVDIQVPRSLVNYDIIRFESPECRNFFRVFQLRKTWLTYSAPNRYFAYYPYQARQWWWEKFSSQSGDSGIFLRGVPSQRLVGIQKRRCVTRRYSRDPIRFLEGRIRSWT